MDGTYTLRERDKPTLREKTIGLINARTKFAVGDWIEFVQVGRIVELTAQHDSNDIRVKVNLITDEYRPNPPDPETQEVYECSKCGAEFEKYWQFDEHYADNHKSKSRKRKKKTE